MSDLQTIEKAIGDWYFDRSSFREMDIQNDLPRNCSSPFSGQLFAQKCLATLSNDGSQPLTCNN